MTISYSLELPTHRVDALSEFVTAAAISDIARAGETSGFAAVHVTDHPAPDAKWLDHGGHHALDPFVALSFAAAATTDVKLLTNVYIAAYRNPFLSAKSIQSLDVLSGGRLILGTAAGYLKPEFKALGIDFDNRGALLDEALDVLTKALSGEDVAYEGTGYNRTPRAVKD
ncbi:LLM class flavin-dependent oxidoreductase, partial [Mycobacterium sp. 1274761.0]|uniref:LLM class flavin-dependent oxidoreductase n=1 Tax=Mycobacterium sp. 1274761.0 TaxID=1834077 RepID=UPI000A4A7B2D